MNATLTRFATGDQGTFGRLALEANPFTCLTAELPWRDNRPDLSRIPVGLFVCTKVWSPHFNTFVYHVQNVPTRQNVEIHWGNWAGDITKGYKSDVEGCILLGTTLDEGVPAGASKSQRCILNSRATVQAFMAATKGADFSLKVQDAFGPST